MSIRRSSRGRRARVCALQMLYQWELSKQPPERVKETYWGEVNVKSPQREYANRLFEETAAGVKELDAAIGAHTRRWRVERLAVVDRNLLRLAITELRRHPETPPAVVFNEALEIAKLFCGEDSREFVNGVLDSVWKELVGAQRAVPGGGADA